MAKFMAGFIIGICCGMIFLAWSVVQHALFVHHEDSGCGCLSVTLAPRRLWSKWEGLPARRRRGVRQHGVRPLHRTGHGADENSTSAAGGSPAPGPQRSLTPADE